MLVMLLAMSKCIQGLCNCHVPYIMFPVIGAHPLVPLGLPTHALVVQSLLKPKVEQAASGYSSILSSG